MTITSDFDSNPRTHFGVAGSTLNVRFVDKSTTDNGVINSWLWKLDDSHAMDAPVSTPYLTGTNFYTVFLINDQIKLFTTGSFPTGLSGTVVYWVVAVGPPSWISISLTKGGAPVTYTNGSGSGSFTISKVSDLQNPVIQFKTIAAGTHKIALTCNDSGGSSAATTTKTDWLKIATGTFTPPTISTAYRNLTLFVYERSLETAPKGSCICRNKTASCNLFFVNLLVQGAMTKAGKATFDIVNTGAGTADEIDLFESTTIGTYKNIAIIGGYDVIWSGKITKAEKEQKSPPGVTPQKAIYHCEAYTDVKKLSDWNIKTPASQVGKSPGQLCTSILDINSGEPDFIGTRGGFIDPSGSLLQMTLTDSDKLTAFSQLTNATDYDWRTRMETMLFQYATFNGSNLITITSAGLTTSALVGNWILFPTASILSTVGSTVLLSAGGSDVITPWTTLPCTGDRVIFSTTGTLPAQIVAGTIYYVVYVNTGGPTAYFKISATKGGAPITYSGAYTTTGHSYVKFPVNNIGVLAWGRITANDATTITAAVTGAAQVPLTLDNCLIVQVPRMDFSNDLMEPDVVRAFTNGVNCVRFTNSDDKVDLFTKVTVRGKDIYTGKTESSGVAAVTPWIGGNNIFTDATRITYKTDTYLYLAPVAADLSHFYALGWNLAWKAGESVYIIQKNNQAIAYYTWTIVALSEKILAGEQVTYVEITTLGALPAINLVGALCCNQRFYVKNKADAGWVSGGPYPAIKIGNEIIYTNSSSGTDTVYGDFLSYTVDSVLYYRIQTDNNVNPHFPGALVWKNTSYNETSPVAGSAVAVHRIINKDIQGAPNSSKSDFEVLASNALLQGSQYYQKSSMNLTWFQFTVNRVRDGVQLTGPVMIREGQKISIVPYTGATAIERQVILWEMDANRMIVSLTLGDYVKDVYNVLDKNTAASQKALL